MLVGQHTAADRFWRHAARTSLLVLLLSALSLLPYLTSSTELVRVRNALSLVETRSGDFDWSPDKIPADFLLEHTAPDPMFVKVADRLGLAALPSDWEKVLAISRHLLSSSPELAGPPIQSNLRDTYRRITENGHGYCGDFTRVFMALAVTVGLPVRAWSFSFDGFGGQGHVLPEVWNRQLGRWQLVDIYNNFYFPGPDGIPMSAAELRSTLATHPELAKRALLDTRARPGYKIEAKYWDYYRQGLDQWYMAWGNNVFSQERPAPVSMAGGISRALEQFLAIALGVYPKVKLVGTDSNGDAVAALWRLHWHLFLVLLVSLPATVLLGICSLRGLALRFRWPGPELP